MTNKHTSLSPGLKAWLILILLSVVWGCSYIVIKKTLLVFSAFQLASARLLVAFLFFMSFGWVYFKWVEAGKLKVIFVAGVLGVLFPLLGFPMAQIKLDSSVVGILNSFTPVCTWLVGMFFYRQKFSYLKLMGVLLGMLGVISLILVKGTGKFSINPYAFFALGVTVCNGFYMNLVKTHLHNVKPLHLAALSMILIGPFALIAVFINNFAVTYQSTPGSGYALLNILYLGLVATALSTILFNRLLQISSPIFASSVTYFMPLVALALGVLDGEKFGWPQLLGIVTILGGVYLLNFERRE